MMSKRIKATANYLAVCYLSLVIINKIFHLLQENYKVNYKGRKIEDRISRQKYMQNFSSPKKSITFLQPIFL